jgi:hypothetical protein
MPLPNISLAPCNKLEEVHVNFSDYMKLSRPLENVFSSITSPKLRKISLTPLVLVLDDNFVWESDSEHEEDGEEEDNGGVEDEWTVQEKEAIIWGSWDTVLCPLAQQVHNAEGKLTLQLNFLGIKSIKIDRILPKFLGCGGLVNINGEGESYTDFRFSGLT